MEFTVMEWFGFACSNFLGLHNKGLNMFTSLEIISLSFFRGNFLVLGTTGFGGK